MRGSDFTQGQHKRDPSAPLDALDAELARAFGRSDALLNRPFTPVQVRAKYTAKPWEFVLCDAKSGGAFSVLLPDPTDKDVAGTMVIVKAASSRWDYNTFVTVLPVSGTIDGQASITIGRTTDSVLLLSNGLEWKIVSHYRPFRWRGGYSLDFTAQASAAIANGSNTIDGRTWTAANVGNCTSVAITQGTGLVFTASTTNTNYTGATRNCPILTIPLLTGIFANYAPGNYIVRLQCRMTLTNADQNYEGGRIGVEDKDAPTNQNYATGKFYNGGSMDMEAVSTVSGTTTARGSDTTAATDDILGVVFEAPKGFESFSGIYDGSGYLNGDTPWHSEVQNMASPLMFLGAQPRAFLCQITANAASNHVTTFTHFQGDFYERHPFTNP